MTEKALCLGVLTAGLMLSGCTAMAPTLVCTPDFQRASLRPARLAPRYVADADREIQSDEEQPEVLSRTALWPLFWPYEIEL